MWFHALRGKNRDAWSKRILEGHAFRLQKGRECESNSIIMDPMCLSLVQQFLDNTSSSLAHQFRHNYEPRKTKVDYEEVLLRWREDQLTKSLVHQHLKTFSSALADDFKGKFQPEETLQTVKVLSKWKDDQLVRGLVFEHLKKVAPSLAVEFQNKHVISVKMIPKKLIRLIDKTLQDPANKERTCQNTEKEDQTQLILPRNRTIINTFTREEMLRIERARTPGVVRRK